MSPIIPALAVFLIGITLLLVKLFIDGQFYIACALICALGLFGVIVAGGMHAKKENQH